MNEELIGQLREVRGEKILTCDLCGLPTGETETIVVEKRSPADADAGIRLCDSCRQKVAADDLPVDLDADAEEGSVLDRP